MNQWQEVGPIKNATFQWRGLLGAAILTPAVLWELFSAPSAPPSVTPYLFFSTLGWVTFLCGMLMRLWATLYVGARKRMTLVNEGPYSICRNPLYVGSFLLGLSLGLFLQSPIVLVALGLAMVLYATGTVPAEERDLRTIHGTPFDEYCRHVPRFIPRFALFQSPDLLELKVKGLKTEWRRMRYWLWMPIVCQLLTLLRFQSFWPHF